MDYFSKLRKRITKYSYIYSEQPKKANLRIFWWTLKCLFKSDLKPAVQDVPTKLKSDKPFRLAFGITGGLGDQLIAINYLSELLKKTNPDKTQVDIYISKQSNTSNTSLLFQNIFPNNLIISDLNPPLNEYFYDLICVINRLPEIKRYNRENVKKYAPKLVKIFDYYLDFKKENYNFFKYTPVIDSLTNQFSLMQGRRRIQQADLGGLLGIKADFTYHFITPDTQSLIQKFKLPKEKIITVNRSVGSAYGKSTKLWPLTNYNKLISLLKKEYPDYTIIQIGFEPKKIKPLIGCDINLANKTNFLEICALLKLSQLHIDCEGGLVHLRRVINGGTSIVLFGPTSPDVFGYDKNINIKGEGCHISCEWILRNWTTCCLKNTYPTPCMASITPELVFNKIKERNIL